VTKSFHHDDDNDDITNIKTVHLPTSFMFVDLRPGENLLLAATSTGFFRDVLAFRSRSTMNFFVFGCPAGESRLLLRLRELRGDLLLVNDDLLMTPADLSVTFGDLVVTSAGR